MVCFFIKILPFFLFLSSYKCLYGFKETAHAGIYSLFGKFSFLYCLYDLTGRIHARRRHLQIRTGSHAFDVVI